MDHESVEVVYYSGTGLNKFEHVDAFSMFREKCILGKRQNIFGQAKAFSIWYEQGSCKEVIFNVLRRVFVFPRSEYQKSIFSQHNLYSFSQR